MTIEEISKYLNLSKSHVYKMTHENNIPHYKPGGKKIYFERMEINRWILKYPVRTDEEYDAIAKSYMKMNRKKK